MRMRMLPIWLLGSRYPYAYAAHAATSRMLRMRLRMLRMRLLAPGYAAYAAHAATSMSGGFLLIRLRMRSHSACVDAR